jgi:hypothetical protein
MAEVHKLVGCLVVLKGAGFHKGALTFAFVVLVRCCALL